MFFVRVILFLLSRRADDAVVPGLANGEPLSDVGRRTSTRHDRIEPTQAPQYGEPHDEGVTREEIMTLFGSALRVR